MKVIFEQESKKRCFSKQKIMEFIIPKVDKFWTESSQHNVWIRSCKHSRNFLEFLQLRVSKIQKGIEEVLAADSLETQ